MMKLFLLGGFRGIVADLLWLRAEEHKRDHDWDRLEDHGRADHQASAPLPLDLDLPGLEPRLQRLGRMGCPRGQVRVDQAGNQVRPGRRQEEHALTRPGLGHGLVLLPQAGLLPTSRSSSAACSATTRTRASRPTTTPRAAIPSSATTISSWVTAGLPGRSAWSTAGANRLGSGTGDDDPVRRPHAPAQGTPDDIAFRSMPAHAQTRYAAGLEKMSTYGIQATFGEVAKNEWYDAWQRVGQVRRARVHVAQRDPARRQAGQRHDPARRRDLPRTLQANAQRKPDVLDDRAGPTR